jgi:diacylglycerol O-acyltransferase / wax synthase
MDKPLSTIDHIMWDVEAPNNLVTVTGMLTFKEPVSKREVMDVVEKRLVLYERFRQTIIEKNGRPVWHDADDFNINAHVHHIALPSPGDHAAMQELISDLISQPLDYSKPLWQAHIVENYRGGTAVVWRIHHAIADGIALVKVVLSLTNETSEASLLEGEPEAEEAVKRTASLWEGIDRAYHVGEDLYQQAKGIIKDPEPLLDSLKDSWESAKEMGKLFFGKSVNDTIYKGGLTVSKKAAFTAPMSLKTIKAYGKQHGATINDVLLMMMTGALRRHMLLHGVTPQEGIRFAVPVNLRKKGEQIKVENKIGVISLELPVHMEDPVERIGFIRKKTELLKGSVEPLLIYNLLHVVSDIMPKEIELKFADVMGSKIAGVLTNVPGPRKQIYFAGKAVEDLMFWVPQTQTLGIGISIISYNNKAYLGAVTDAGIVDDPEEIVAGFRLEFERISAELAAK